MNNSKGVRFFCHPEELQTILDPVLSKTGTQLCIVERRGDREFLIESSSARATKSTYPKFYVCSPAMISGSGLRTLADVVQIWFPAVIDGSLRMGEIGMLVDESELDAGLQKLQNTVYRALRKVLVDTFRKGVWGRNAKTGGEHFYSDILISDRAMRMHADGIVLATQMGDGFVTYHVETRKAG
jgi:hypothetical protein